MMNHVSPSSPQWLLPSALFAFSLNYDCIPQFFFSNQEEPIPWISVPSISVSPPLFFSLVLKGKKIMEPVIFLFHYIRFLFSFLLYYHFPSTSTFYLLPNFFSPFSFPFFSFLPCLKWIEIMIWNKMKAAFSSSGSLARSLVSSFFHPFHFIAMVTFGPNLIQVSIPSSSCQASKYRMGLSTIHPVVASSSSVYLLCYARSNFQISHFYFLLFAPIKFFFLTSSSWTNEITQYRPYYLLPSNLNPQLSLLKLRFRILKMAATMSHSYYPSTK